MKRSFLLQPEEEAQLLSNLLCDDEDWISRRLLELHYHNNAKGKEQNEKTDDQ